jgi:uncharacterized membrane protein
MSDKKPAAATTRTRPASRAPRIVRIVRARPRLFAAAAIAVIIAAFTPRDWLPVSRLLAGWDVGVACYITAISQLLATGSVSYFRRRAEGEDEGRFGVLVLTAIASLASLGAIVALLGLSHAGAHDPWQLALAVATILLSWGFIHTIFAVHYATEFYDAERRKVAGIAFPGDKEPDYWDFLYFSFVIGMTSQVSDVAVASKPIRRIVLAHGIVAFLFNVTVLALVVNIAASVI